VTAIRRRPLQACEPETVRVRIEPWNGYAAARTPPSASRRAPNRCPRTAVTAIGQVRCERKPRTDGEAIAAYLSEQRALASSSSATSARSSLPAAPLVTGEQRKPPPRPSYVAFESAGASSGDEPTPVPLACTLPPNIARPPVEVSELRAIRRSGAEPLTSDGKRGGVDAERLRGPLARCLATCRQERCPLRSYGRNGPARDSHTPWRSRSRNVKPDSPAAGALQDTAPGPGPKQTNGPAAKPGGKPMEDRT